MNPKGQDEDAEIIVAVIAKDSEKARFWKEFFGGMQVPVTKDIPNPTILADGRECLCYFVDFYATGPKGMRLIAEANARRNNDPRVTTMLRQGIYPILAEGVTVVRCPLRMWNRD